MRRYVVAAIVVLALVFASAVSVFAHEHRHVGEYEMVVGWLEEPPYTGFQNAVQLRLSDRAGKPVLDLGDTLKVEVIYMRDKTEAAPLVPAFSEKTGRQGEYRMPLIPTRPGSYTFRFVGTIKDQKVDESFTASDSTFDLVQSPSQIEFPAKDPSREELALRIQRMGPRIDRLRDSEDRLKQVTAVALGIGLAGLVAAVVAIRIRRPRWE